jgi:hypothetical protein
LALVVLLELSAAAMVATVLQPSLRIPDRLFAKPSAAVADRATLVAVSVQVVQELVRVVPSAQRSIQAETERRGRPAAELLL